MARKKGRERNNNSPQISRNVLLLTKSEHEDHEENLKEHHEGQ
jgi:hypothetical protein